MYPSIECKKIGFAVSFKHKRPVRGQPGLQLLVFPLMRLYTLHNDTKIIKEVHLQITPDVLLYFPTQPEVFMGYEVPVCFNFGE